MANRAAPRLEKSDAARGGLREVPVTVPSALRRWVASIAMLESAPSYVVLPRTYAQLLLRRGAGSSRIDATVNGPRTTLLRKTFASGRALSVRFRAGAIQRLFGVAASHVADAAVPLADLIGRAAEPLVDELAGRDPDLAASLTSIERWLVQRVPPPKDDDPRDVLMMFAASALDREPGLRIAELAHRLGLSERQLRRRFADVVGVSPKTYANVTRFQRVLELAGRQPRSWADVALMAGYYDQPHMIDDVRAVAGATPKALLAELAGRIDDD